MILLLFATSFLTVLCFICCRFRRRRREATGSANQAKSHGLQLIRDHDPHSLLSQTHQEDVEHKIQIDSDHDIGLSSSVDDPTVTDHQPMTVKPGRPRALSVTSDSIELEWTKPEQGAHNVITYSIFYRSANDPPDHWIQHEIKSDMQTLTVSGLSECTPHYFKVKPECEVGIGLESDVSDPIHTKMIIPSKPGKPKATNVTHDSVQLEWTEPEQGAHSIISYTVFYHSACDPTDMRREYKASTIINKGSEVIVHQLSENTRYYFKIRPESNIGIWLESDVSDPIQTEIIIPSKPGKPKVSSITHNSVQIEWTKPEQGAHNVTSYMIWYHPANYPQDEWLRLRTDDTKEKATVPNLSENTFYMFTIQPEYKGGVGTESDVSKPAKTQRALTFVTAVKKLWNAREKWYYIGLCLGINKTDLDIIEKDNQRDTDSCFRKMFTLWFSRVSGTWHMLIDALRDNTVGCHDLANSIAVELSDVTCESMVQSGEGFECPLCHNCSLEKYLKGECPKFHSSSDSAFPYLDTNKLTEDEKLTLHVKFVKETDNLNHEFNDLVYQLTELLEEMPSEKLTKVSNYVKYRLSISDPLLDSEVITASAIIKCLKEAASFFNYNNIQNVITKFGTEKDKEKLTAYETSFKRYCKRSVFEVPEAVFGPPPDRGEMLTFKVSAQLIENIQSNPSVPISHHTVIKSASTLHVSLGDALKVQMKIAEVLGIENVGNLVFLGASKGCVKLKFSAPNATLDTVKEQHNVKTITELPGFAELEAANIHLLCGPPGKPYAINVTSNSVHLQWSKPGYQGSHPIQHYCVHYKSLKVPMAKWRTMQSKAFVENLEIGRLSQNETPFIFKVQAVNLVGAGVLSEKSDPIDLKQLQPMLIEGDIPSKPGKPQALSISHDIIQLEWTKPEKGNENITSYTILYRSQFNDPPNQWMEKSTTSPDNMTVISNLFENTTYLFQVLPECEVGIGLESDLSDPIITKMIIPSKPSKPRAKEVTNDSIELEWTKPQQGSYNIISYTVFCRSTNDPTDIWNEHKAVSKEEMMLTQLSDNTTYRFKIRPECKAGFGLESDISEPITTRMIIPSKPGKPKAMNITHDSIQLEWTKPEQGAHNITYYAILYRSTNDQPDKWIQHKVKSTKENLVVSELSEYTFYHFKIRPECGVGIGLESDVNDSIQTKMILPSKPGKPKATKVAHDSIQLEWTKPKQGAHNITSYTVFYCCTTSDSHGTWREYKASIKEEVTVPQLSENMIYCFKIRPECEAGIGLESDVSEPIRTKVIIPSQPGKPKCSSVSHNSIQLEWTKPQQGTHNITAYRVFYRSHNDSSDQWIEQKVKGAKEITTVSNLLERTVYFFKVQPECIDGVGLESDISEPITTKMIIPSKPGKPRASMVTNDSIELKWTKPEQGAHNVTSYSVLCSLTSKPADNWTEHTTKERIIISQLRENATYCFEVQPQYVDGDGPQSEASDPISTKMIIPSKPGKPKCINSTNESIEIEWTKPKQGAHNITSYTVLYCSAGDPSNQWIQHKIKSTIEKLTVSGLSEYTSYFFKIRPVCEVGFGLESATSDPIQTKMIIPSKPGKPKALNITHNLVQLEWRKPEQGAHNITSYTVFYRSANDPPNIWREYKAITEEEVLLPQLSENTIYYFKTRLQCKAGVGLESDISEPIRTKVIIPSQPGKPKCSSVSHDSIRLEWNKPEQGAHNIAFYTVFYSITSKGVSEPIGEWKTKKTNDIETSITITNLQAETVYQIKVRAECQAGGSEYSIVTEIQTLRPPLATLMKSISTPIKTDRISKNLTVFELPKNEIFRTKEIRKVEVGKPSLMVVPHKVLMVMGATGAGKSTLINTMANYILGVTWKDDFRFQLIVDQAQSQINSQINSVTREITAYTIYHSEGCNIPCSITIIDTPGVGNTSGVERDMEITVLIKDFFSLNGIDHLDGIGLVIQAAMSRLTPWQKYVLNSTLSNFGRDVANNIFLMATFSDYQEPPVVEAVKQANVPYSAFFKFNNSALYADKVDYYDSDSDDVSFDEMFWKLSMKSMKDFFTMLQKAESVSLVMTRDVLNQREKLETAVFKVQSALNQCFTLYEAANDRKSRQEKITDYYEAQLERHYANLCSFVEEAHQHLTILTEIALKPNLIAQLDLIQLLIECETNDKCDGWHHRLHILEKFKDQAALLALIKDHEDIDQRINEERLMKQPGWEKKVERFEQLQRIRHAVDEIKQK